MLVGTDGDNFTGFADFLADSAEKIGIKPNFGGGCALLPKLGVSQRT
jgi:hypothetical protein